LPAGHLDLARSLNNLGLFYEGVSLPERAVRAHEEALAIRKKALQEGHADIAKSLDNLGTAYRGMGRYELARQCHQQALAIRRKEYPAGNFAVVYTLVRLAAAQAGLVQSEEAIRCLEEALAIHRKAQPGVHPEIARVLTNLGAAYRNAGRFDRARQCQEEAIALQRRVLPAGHPELSRSQSELGTAYARLGQPGEAWRICLEACSPLTEFQRAVLLGMADGDRRPVFPAPRLALHHLLALAESDRETSAQRLGELYRQVLAQKGLSGLTLRLRREAELCAGEENARTLYRDLRQARKRLADALVGGPEPKFPERYRERCRALRQERDRLELLLVDKVPGYAAVRAADVAGADQVAARLPPGAALAQFCLFENTDRKDMGEGLRYLALVLWRDADGKARLRLVPFGAASHIDKAVHDWRAAVLSGGPDAKQSERLRRAVWDPFAAALPLDVRRLLVAPEGELALLPFEAIRLGDGQYLVQRYPVQYLASGFDLLTDSVVAPREKRGSAVLLADPAFDSTEGISGSGMRKPSSIPPAGRDMHFQKLRGFAGEVAAVERLLGKRPDWKVETLTGENANEVSLGRLKRPRLLYLITHGFFLTASGPVRGELLHYPDSVELDWSHWLVDPARDPRTRSGLALAGANKARERLANGMTDGLLTALDVERLDLRGTDLVILSAWEGGRGEVAAGEGVFGLRNAFQRAGARTVVATLWKGPEARTEKLVTSFLGHWLKGQGKAEALRLAQLEIIRALGRDSDPTVSAAPPLYWAGFVCQGRPD
jgi:CHAT domain-containing protein/tetratricopeptide (TPR) repeat protein